MPIDQIIKAVIIDIDGCLAPKSFGLPLNLDALMQIQDLSREQIRDPAIPMFILNTGRDINHTELMAKVIDGFKYFIIEMGAALVSIHGAESIIITHPQITDQNLALLNKLQKNFLAAYPQYQPQLQFGKRYMFTFLFEIGDPNKVQCAKDLISYCNANNYPFQADEGHNFVNVIFPKINKGSGLELLFKNESDLCEKNIAGIGDSTGDWEFLQRCAFRACPNNGSDFLKKHCDYIADCPEAEGILEIIHYIIKRNRYFLHKLKETRKKPSKLITAVISDINGTIDSATYGKVMDLTKMKKIRNLIEHSNKDSSIPQIILNTGWDLNYTALYIQILNATQYHIIERGAAIIKIKGPQMEIHTDPRIKEELMAELVQVEKGFLAMYPHYNRFLQVGKKYMISFQFEMGTVDLEECVNDLKKYIKSFDNKYEIETGPNYINIGIPGINKGTGAELLMKIEPNFHFENTVGIGDSDGDWDYMQLCGFTACPANASRFLKSKCNYVASKIETEGFIEILEQIIQWNLENSLKK